MKAKVSNELVRKSLTGESLYDSIKKSLAGSSEFISDEKKLKKRMTRRNLFPRDIAKLFSLSYRQLSEWERRGVHLGERKSKRLGSWRKYSMEDSISFAIVMALRDIGVPLKKSRRVIRNLQNSDLVEKALMGFLNDDRVILYFNPEENCCKLLTSANEAIFMKEVRGSDTPMVLIPLNLLFSYVFTQSGSGDITFSIKGSAFITAAGKES